MTFLFERDFDDEHDALCAAREAPPPRAAGLDPAMVAQLRAEAHAAGLAEGLAQGRAEAEAEMRASLDAQLVDTLGALLPAVNDLRADLAAHHAAREEDLMRLTRFIAARLLPELTARLAPRRIDAFCRKAIHMAIGAEGLTLNVAPDMLPAVVAALGHANHRVPVTIEADPALPASAATARWTDGGATISGEELAAEILTTLDQLIPSDRPGAETT